MYIIEFVCFIFAIITCFNLICELVLVAPDIFTFRSQERKTFLLIAKLRKRHCLSSVKDVRW